ncbi:MAG: hypothetical protein ACREX0_10740, partial [Noviherbaspirillum sp.]
ALTATPHATLSEVRLLPAHARIEMLDSLMKNCFESLPGSAGQALEVWLTGSEPPPLKSVQGFNNNQKKFCRPMRIGKLHAALTQYDSCSKTTFLFFTC